MLKQSLKISVLLPLLLSTPVQAEKVLTFKENDNVALSISRDNFNRLLVAGDKITNLRFPQNYLSIENDKDGSVYLDAKDDRPFTLFVTTQKGRHFSATITLSQSQGQTIKFVPFKPKPKRLVTKSKPKLSHQTKLVRLIKAVEKEKNLAGYTPSAANGKPVSLVPNLKSHFNYALENNHEIAQKFTLENRGWKPIRFDEKWFKNKETLALLVKSNVIYPHQSLEVIRVQGASHG